MGEGLRDCRRTPWNGGERHRSERSDDVLTIKGEKKEEKEKKKKDYYFSERRYGSFQRSFRVPDGVDSSKIEAKFKNGVLTVTLPKSPETQKKQQKIEVKKA